MTSNNGRGGDRFLPYVFTEQGVTQENDNTTNWKNSCKFAFLIVLNYFC